MLSEPHSERKRSGGGQKRIEVKERISAEKGFHLLILLTLTTA